MKNWHAVVLIIFLLAISQLIWHLTAKGII